MTAIAAPAIAQDTDTPTDVADNTAPASAEEGNAEATYGNYDHYRFGPLA